MGPKTQELIQMLTEIIFLLEREGETHWSGWMQRAKMRLEDRDYSGIEYLLSAYGGMGSFNDLMVSVERQDHFGALRTKAWELAEEIKRDHTVDSG
jgi:hypothetical protein